MVQNTDHAFMQKAINLSVENVKTGGGPFGAVIVKDGQIVGQATNSVTLNNDPTAHAEVNAIRQACKNLGTFDLSGCTLYTSCEPCPMCLGAIYWARINKVYFGNTKADAKAIGFDDSFIYDEFEKPIELRYIKFEQLLPDQAIKAFNDWQNSDIKREY